MLRRSFLPLQRRRPRGTPIAAVALGFPRELEPDREITQHGRWVRTGGGVLGTGTDAGQSGNAVTAFDPAPSSHNSPAADRGKRRGSSPCCPALSRTPPEIGATDLLSALMSRCVWYCACSTALTPRIQRRRLVSRIVGPPRQGFDRGLLVGIGFDLVLYRDQIVMH